MIEKNVKKPVFCDVSNFRYLANTNNISVLDGTYLEMLITHLVKNQNYICSEGLIDLEELVDVFSMSGSRGVKLALQRLYDLKALIIYKKTGKHHKSLYIISINLDYIKCFSQDKE